MSKGYQRLEEMEEKTTPEPKSKPRASSPTKLGPLLLIAVLVLLLGATIFYAAKVTGQVDTLKATAANTQRDAQALNQQIKALEGERNTLTVKVNDLTTQLKAAEEEKTRLTQEIDNLKKSRKPPTKKAGKRA